MPNHKSDSLLAKVAYATISVIGIGWLLSIGSGLIIPFIFAILLAAFLYPIEKYLLRFVKFKGVAICLSFLTLLLPILFITTLFSMQLIAIMESLPSIGMSMTEGLDELLNQVNKLIPLANLNTEKLLSSGGENIQGPLLFISKSFVSTTAFLTSLGMVFIYTFFLLYYRNSFNNFIIYQFEKSNRPDIKEAMDEIKKTIQSYIGGVGLVMVILSVLNSIGLTLIGIEYAVFWGTLAGFLAVIPFIGTLIGGVLPFIYALSTTDTNWQPIAVLIFYLVVQQIEGNFITPRIVGDKVDVNPLFAIFSLMFFGTFWGIAGIILAIPIISIVKIVLSNFEDSKAYAVLMSSNINNKKGIFRRLAQD